jgi:hypothetical protein
LVGLSLLELDLAKVERALDATVRARYDWQLPELLMSGRRHGRPPLDLVTWRTAHGADLAKSMVSVGAGTDAGRGGRHHPLSHEANRIGTGLTGSIAT